GAYSVQSRYKKAYNPDTLNFLRELRPYLVIALNNAIHSQKLQNEIIRNKEIQAKLKEANDMLSKIAGLDALTQISNRREFTEKFHELRKEAAKSNKIVSVFMFDIDDFKKYNDTYGHFEGDEALKKVAKIINSNIIECGGIAARFGGEEFISACIGLTSEENAALGNKIREEIFDLA
ncbi:diguanylate cyclase (GGDEF) domain protein, partial [Fusobacterium sp. CM21]